MRPPMHTGIDACAKRGLTARDVGEIYRWHAPFVTSAPLLLVSSNFLNPGDQVIPTPATYPILTQLKAGEIVCQHTC